MLNCKNRSSRKVGGKLEETLGVTFMRYDGPCNGLLPYKTFFFINFIYLQTFLAFEMIKFTKRLNRDKVESLESLSLVRNVSTL